MRKRTRKIKGFLYYFMVSFSLLLLLFIFQKKIDSIEEIHCLYSRNVFEVRTSNIDDFELLKYFGRNTKKEMKIVLEEMHPFLELKGIYYRGKVISIPLVEGRFFTCDESQGNENKIVVGYQYIEEIYDKKGEKYYQLEGKEYEVVGIIGREKGSRFNTMIFLPFKTATNRFGTSGVYLIDGMTEKMANTILQNNLKQQDEISVKKLYDSYFPDFLREMKEDNGMIGIYVFLMFLIIVCSCLGMNYCMKIERSNIKVYKILGISTWLIVNRCLKEYGIVIFFSFVTSMICGELFKKIIGIYLINYHIVVIGFLIFYLIINIILCLKVIVSVKMYSNGENE